MMVAYCHSGEYMILEDSTYKRNKKGQIIKRQIVKLRCDNIKCLRQWTSQFQNRKKRKCDKDFCRSCVTSIQNDFRFKKHKANVTHKVCIECIFCAKKVYKRIRIKNNSKNDGKFCSTECKIKFHNKEKYGNLDSNFNNNINSVAYLFGLILGDGTFVKSAKNTTRVSIAFDVKYSQLLQTAKEVCDKLGIIYYVQPKKHHGCYKLGFTLPDQLLFKYNLLFSGDKSKSNPVPSEIIIQNINFAIGLFNSDGCKRIGSTAKNGNHHYTYRFSNTVRSIIQSYKKCLLLNNIQFLQYFVEGRIDKRTGNTSKNSWIIMISKKQHHHIFQTAGDFKIKPTSN